MDIGGVELQVDLEADGGLRALVIVLAHLRGARGRPGGRPKRGGGGDLGAVGGRCEVVARAGSERPAGAGTSARFRPSTVEAGNRGDSPRRLRPESFILLSSQNYVLKISECVRL